MRNTIALFSLIGLLLAPVVYSAEPTQDVWDKQCAKCHGKNGDGQTTMGKKLKVKDYTKEEDQKKFTDEEAFKVTKEGKKEGSKTLMKGFGSTLSDKEIKDLVALVRKMKTSQ